MSDDIGDIAGFYNSHIDLESSRLDQNQLEYDMTWRWLERCLPGRGSILEVGAAAGHYTLELAKRGYRVCAVDLSAGLLAECRKRITWAGLDERVTFAVADARDLSQVEGSGFDAALLMGPLYHLVVESDRALALRQAHERLRAGGVLVSTWCTRFGALEGLMRHNPGWIENQPEVRALLEKGRRPDDAPRGGFRGYFARVGEVIPLHEAAGFETIVLAGIEPVIASDDEIYNRLKGRQRSLWLDLLDEISTEESILGASGHLLYIGKKAA